MLHVKATDAILNGLNYHLTPDQAHAMELLLKTQEAPKEPWIYTHWSEAGACAALHQAGYKLITPYEQADSRAKSERERDGQPDETDEHKIKCPECNGMFAQQLMRKNPEPRTAEGAYRPHICVTCLETAGAELALELKDLKASVEGKDVEGQAALQRQCDTVRFEVDELKKAVFTLEAEKTDLRQRLLIARDPASEAKNV